MNKDVELSRRRVSRRRALALGGTISLGGLLAVACGIDNGSSTATTTAGSATTDATAAASGSIEEQLRALLDQAPNCVMTSEETQGPYWFDVDSIRRDIREDHPGLELQLALRVQDLQNCSADGSASAVANAVVEIWHCDAGGGYSGFESGSIAANQGGGQGPGGPGGTPPPGGPGGPGGPSGPGGFPV